MIAMDCTQFKTEIFTQTSPHVNRLFGELKHRPNWEVKPRLSKRTLIDKLSAGRELHCEPETFTSS